ncbi:MAG: ribulose-phosphate 3-epimerase [Candidatus Eutrophobiaceae bacterium]
MPSQLEYVIAPSILAADFARLAEEVDAVIGAGADWIHVDVMDNHYVPNLSFGPLVVEALQRHGVSKPLDVHLMVKPVDRLIAEFARAGAQRISIHPEATDHLDRSLQLILDQGCKAAVVLNPATPLECLHYVLDKIDMVLLMSVNPGFGGQTFIAGTLTKIARLRKLLDGYGRAIRLQVDGGVNVRNIRSIADAGADTFVLGSAIFGADDYREAIAALRAQLPC